MHYDYIVIGVGSMGASTCYHLSKSGKKVLGLEQFEIVHEKGSHAGQSRIIRKAYYEHPDYIPLLKRAYENWKEIEAVSGSKIYYETGLFYAAPSNHEIIANIRSAATEYKIPLLDSSKNDQYEPEHCFDLPEDYEWLYEPEAGFIHPEEAIKTYVNEARKRGVEFRENEKVTGWDVVNDAVRVKTNKTNYTCKKIIVTAGAWSAKLMPAVKDKLRITRQTLMWLEPSDKHLFLQASFPCWLIAHKGYPGAYYGFPIADFKDDKNPIGFKFAYHYPGAETDPDCVDRTITDEDIRPLLDFINQYIPKAKGPVLGVKTCLYSNSADEHFVIDNLAGMEDKVCFARGFSGHGFKFVSVIGEIMADLALYGKTALPVSFLSANRFN